MTGFTPTDEQLAALELFQAGDSMVIEALAGTGKTSTLRLLAENTSRRGQYVAFNKAIVTDVKGTLPHNFRANTAHSLAYGAVGKHYQDRLKAGRMRSNHIAKVLDIRPQAVTVGDDRKVLGDSYLAGVAMRAITRFCQTSDEKPTRRHVRYIDGIDLPTSEGRRTYDNNNLVAAYLEPFLENAWEDLKRSEGNLQFKHEHYLKLWQLSHPTVPVDVILFDECQDASPVMAAVVAEQNHAQVVYVGDPNQSIYGWTGAIDAIDAMKAQGLPTSRLSQSFRFGPDIADCANDILLDLDSDVLLRGLSTIDSRVGKLTAADAVLTRTNAVAVSELLEAQRDGVHAHLVGGGADVLSFANAAADLMMGKSTWHPELACFNSWWEVQEYVRNDEQGDELKLLAKLVDEYGVRTIRNAIELMPTEDRAEFVISTAHKSKGREWSRVRLSNDFASMPPNEPELRLRYVAVTRAKHELDDSGLHAGVAVPFRDRRVA